MSPQFLCYDNIAIRNSSRQGCNIVNIVSFQLTIPLLLNLHGQASFNVPAWNQIDKGGNLFVRQSPEMPE